MDLLETVGEKVLIFEDFLSIHHSHARFNSDGSDEDAAVNGCFVGALF